MANPVIFGPTSAWYAGGYDWTGATHTIRLSVGRAEVDDARLGDDIDAKYPGITVPSLEMTGFFSAGSGEPDPIFFDRIKQTFTGVPNSVCAENSTTAGSVWYTVFGTKFAYDLGAAHGESLQFTARVGPRSGGSAVAVTGKRPGNVFRGLLLLPKALRTGTTTGSAVQVGSDGGSSVASVLHVFAITGGSLTVTIESDNGSGFPSPTVINTHTAVTTAPNSEVIVSGATIGTDTWLRAVATYTPGTDFTCAVMAARSVSFPALP